MKLTKRTVDAAAPAVKRYEIWDEELSGFGLRVETSGKKTFIVRYRTGAGGRAATRRNMALGRYGVLTPDQARQKAREVLGAVATGGDPAGEMGAKAREITLAALIALYEVEGCHVQRGLRQGQPMKPRTKAYTMARLRHHVVPLLGRRRVTEVKAGDIERFVRDVASGKTAKDQKLGPRKRVIVRGGEGAARKVVRDLSAVFSFARRHGIVSENPCGVAAIRKTDNRCERFLTLDEVRQLGQAFMELEADRVNPKAINIARLWALTGCRRDEIAALRWSEICFERGLLILEESKTGKSVRPLGSAALALLSALPRDPHSEFVFPAESGNGHYQGTKRVWPKVIEKARLPGITPHTMRHTLGSTAVSTGEAMLLTGAILGHKTARATGIYAHIQTTPAQRAADRVSRKIAAALEGKPPGKISPIRRKVDNREAPR